MFEGIFITFIDLGMGNGQRAMAAASACGGEHQCSVTCCNPSPVPWGPGVGSAGLLHAVLLPKWICPLNICSIFSLKKSQLYMLLYLFSFSYKSFSFVFLFSLAFLLNVFISVYSPSYSSTLSLKIWWFYFFCHCFSWALTTYIFYLLLLSSHLVCKFFYLCFELFLHRVDCFLGF